MHQRTSISDNNIKTQNKRGAHHPHTTCPQKCSQLWRALAPRSWAKDEDKRTHSWLV